MVGTAVAQRLPWDAFCEQEGPVRAAIDGFREIEWPNIRRQMRTEHHVEVPDSQEPHWVAPGRARLWRHEQSSAYGRTEDYGWQLSAQGIPCHNASQIVGFLRLGYQFRPPVEETVGTVEQDQPAAPIGGANNGAEPEKVFVCARHGQGRYEFKTWRGYTVHCGHKKESLQETPPPALLEAMRSYRWFCLAHSVGFQTWRAANKHVAFELSRERPHKPVKEMEVQQ